MDAISRWLLQDEQTDLWEIVFALIVNLVFISVSFLAMWPLGRPALAGQLAKGYAVLWILVLLITIVLIQIQRLVRASLYDNFNLFLASNLAVSTALQVGWAAFAALTIPGFTDGAAAWVVVLVYVLGVLSCIAAFFVVSSFYQGDIYKLVSLPLALGGFLVFSLWPESGRFLYGWFFDLF